jgi:hypothetical protein
MNNQNIIINKIIYNKNDNNYFSNYNNNLDLKIVNSFIINKYKISENEDDDSDKNSSDSKRFKSSFEVENEVDNDLETNDKSCNNIFKYLRKRNFSQDHTNEKKISTAFGFGINQLSIKNKIRLN